MFGELAIEQICCLSIILFVAALLLFIAVDKWRASQ